MLRHFPLAAQGWPLGSLLLHPSRAISSSGGGKTWCLVWDSQLDSWEGQRWPKFLSLLNIPPPSRASVCNHWC